MVGSDCESSKSWKIRRFFFLLLKKKRNKRGKINRKERKKINYENHEK